MKPGDRWRVILLLVLGLPATAYMLVKVIDDPGETVRGRPLMVGAVLGVIGVVGLAVALVRNAKSR